MLWVKCEKGYRVIIRKYVIFSEYLTPCLEGKENLLTVKHVQTEVESSHMSKILLYLLLMKLILEKIFLYKKLKNAQEVE